MVPVGHAEPRLRLPVSFAAVRGVRDVGARLQRHAPALEVGAILVLIGVSLGSLAVAPGRLAHLDAVLFAVLLPAGLLLRRASERLSFCLVALTALAQWFLSTPQLADLAVLIAFLWVTLETRPRDIAWAAVTVEIGAVMAALRWSPDKAPKVWIAVTGFAVAAGALGLVIRERRALLASTQERAARLVMERDQEGRLATAAERARIAREMHDIISHNLTVMIALADGVAYALREPPPGAAAAIEKLSSTGRMALEDMRRLLGVLHDEASDRPREPQPGLGDLPGLIASVEAAGIPVNSTIDDGASELASGIQLALFRVAQEALTNALKHAPRPAVAQLSVALGPGQIQLTVTNTAAPRSQPPLIGSAHAGRGLAGMRERASAFGGQLTHGPIAGGGWQVRLVVPHDAGRERARP